MPELPEIHTTKATIQSFIIGQTITKVKVRQYRLRYDIDADISNLLIGQKLTFIDRRSKYLLLFLEDFVLLVHLGMSGSLSIEKANTILKKHEHYEIIFSDDLTLRYCDPRRFGLLLILDPKTYKDHKLLKYLGPEPLSEAFNNDYLYKLCQAKNTTIKTLLMDSKAVVGIGNIYSNEILFQAKIHPLSIAKCLDKAAIQRLVKASKKILQAAIAKGGTTLRDYKNGHGKIGYFQQHLFVYNREEKVCKLCKTKIQKFRQNGRSSFVCINCQQQY